MILDMGCPTVPWTSKHLLRRYLDLIFFPITPSQEVFGFLGVVIVCQLFSYSYIYIYLSITGVICRVCWGEISQLQLGGLPYCFEMLADDVYRIRNGVRNGWSLEDIW